MFNHKNQKQFYSDYAIKDGQALNEANLNLFGKRLKKEVDDVHNLLQIFGGLKPIEYSAIVEYEENEIVSWKGKNYISVASTQGEEPGVSQKWMELTGAIIQGQGLNTLGDYLSKYNQQPYEPGELSEGENTITYHPATVKFVEDRIAWYLKNGVITNADRLDGYHASYFATLEQLTEIEAKIKSNDLSKFEPYIIPFTTNDMNKIATTIPENFESVLTKEAFNNLYSVISKLEKYDLRFSDTDNQVLATNLEANETEMKLMLCISGPFKGFGCSEDDFVNGMITMRITLNLQRNSYSNIEIQSNILKKVTQKEYDALPVKSEFINYIITQDYPESVELVSYLKLFKTKDATKGSLRWSDPSNFRSSRLVFNPNNIPVSEVDGTIIEEILQKNKYAINGILVDISQGGYYKIFPKTARGSYYSDSRNAISVDAIEDLPSHAVSDFKIVSQDKAKIKISWIDPADYVCLGSKIVIKEGNAPDTPEDGTALGDYEISTTAHEIEITIPKSGLKHFIKIFPKLFNGSYANSKLNVLEVQYTTEMWARIDETQSNPALAISHLRDAKRSEDIYLRVSQNLGANPLVNVSTNIPIADLKYNTSADGLNLQPFSNICTLTDEGKWQITAPNATYRLYHKDFYARIGELKVGSGATSIDFYSDSIGERQLNEYAGMYNSVITQNDGKELYRLNPDDLTKTQEGETADITTLGNDVFTTFPRKGFVMYPEAYSFYDYDKIEDYTISENFAADIGGWRLKSITLRNKDKTNDYIDCIFEQIVGDGTVSEVTKSYAITKDANTSNKIEYTADINLDTRTATLKFSKPLQFDYTFAIPAYAAEFSVKSVAISADKFYLNIQYTCKDDKNVTTTIYDTCRIPWDLNIQTSQFDYEFITGGTKWSIKISNMLLAYKRKQGRMWTAKYLEPYTLTEKLAGYDSVSIRNASVRSDNNYIDIVYQCTKGATVTNVSKGYAITAASKKHLSSLDNMFKNTVECTLEYTSDTAIVNIVKLVCNSQISTGKYVYVGVTDAPDAREIKDLACNHSVVQTPIYEYPAFTWEHDISESDYVKYRRLTGDDKRRALNDLVIKEDCESFSISTYAPYESGGTIYSSSARAPRTSIDLSTSRRYCRAKGEAKGYTLATTAQRHYISALYCIIFGHLNAQTKIGLGYGRDSWDGNYRACSSGSGNKLGMNYEFATDTQRTNGWSQVKMLGIEDYWGNIWQWYDGLRINGSGELLVANGNFDRVDMYENIGSPGSDSDSGVHFSSIQGTTLGGFTPAHEGSISGSDSTYYSDMFWQLTNTAALFGGRWTDRSKCGPFCLSLNGAPSSVSVGIGLRLAKFNALGALEKSKIRAIIFNCAGGSLEGIGDFGAPGEDGNWETKTSEAGRLENLPTPKYPGYKFLGWYLGDTKVTTGKTYYVDTELTAKWEIIPRYTITFAADGGTITGEATRTTNDSMQIESLPEVSKEGFHFLGWFLGDSKISLETEYSTNTTVTAKWQQIYKVQFVLDGGTLVSGNNPSYTDAQRRLTSYPEVTREGFTFAGWFDSPTDGTQYGIGSEYTGNIVLYARWNAN